MASGGGTESFKKISDAGEIVNFGETSCYGAYIY